MASSTSDGGFLNGRTENFLGDLGETDGFARRRSNDPKACPSCGSLRGLVYSTKDPIQYRKCEDCGRTYKTAIPLDQSSTAPVPRPALPPGMEGK